VERAVGGENYADYEAHSRLGVAELGAGHHDRPRWPAGGEAQARVAAMLLLTLRGTPTLYYGDEIGMHQVAIAPDQVRDPFEKNVPGIGVGRDGCRTPMQWNATPYAGFSTATPWLPLSDDLRRRTWSISRRTPGRSSASTRRLSAYARNCRN